MNDGKSMINRENNDLERSVKQVLTLQVVVSASILVLVAAVSLILFEAKSAESVGLLVVLGKKLGSSLYGSGLAIAGTILSARSVRRASRATGAEINLAMVSIYSGLMNKLVIVGGGIAFGLIALKLGPVEMIVSYIVVQFASVWTMLKPETGTGD